MPDWKRRRLSEQGRCAALTATVQVAPVGFEFDSGNEQFLSVVIEQAFDDFEGGGNTGMFTSFFAGTEMVEEADINILALAVSGLFADAACSCEPESLAIRGIVHPAGEIEVPSAGKSAKLLV